MYINYGVMTLKGLSLHDVAVLQLIKQNKIEDLSQEIESEIKDTTFLEKMSNMGYIEVIKGTAKQSYYQKLRTTKKANDVLEDISIPLVDEDSLRIFEWVKKIYQDLSKELGNQKKCKMYIAQFAAESGISRNALAFLIQTFLNDDKEMEFSQRLEYLFYKGSSVFSVRFDLNQSRLYQFYQKQENYFDEKFKTL